MTADELLNLFDRAIKILEDDNKRRLEDRKEFDLRFRNSLRKNLNIENDEFDEN